MSDYTKFLFIGGAADGKRIAVYNDQPTVIFNLPVKFDYTLPPSNEVAYSAEDQRQEYQKVKLRSGDNFYWVFTCGDPDNVIADLIDGYGTKTNTLRGMK